MPSERAAPGDHFWNRLSAEHLPRYLFALPFAEGKSALDAGCGTGYGAALLATGPSPAQAVTAIDKDAPTIQAAAATFAAIPSLNFIADDCHTLARAPGPYDLICCFEVLEHVQDPDRVLAALASRLSPAGILLVSTPDRANTPPYQNGKPANPFHHQEWLRDDFLKLLTPHFAHIDLRVQVQSHSLSARFSAVDALRQSLTWSNPLAALLFRKTARTRSTRSWKALEALAAPAISDYPIVEHAVATIWGTSFAHFAICRQPRHTP